MSEAASGWPQAVLWDIDGTLIESTELAWTSTNKVLASNGFAEISKAEYKEATRFTTPARFAFHATKDPNSEIGAKLGADFDGLYTGLVSSSTVPLFPGLKSLIEELVADSVPLGALSNACGAYVRAVLLAHGFSGHFQCQLGADEVEEAKPAPGGLRRCCEVMKVAASPACVYIGDSPSDGKAAKAAGLRSIGVRWGAGKEEALQEAFDEVVSSAEELRAALRRIAEGGGGGGGGQAGHSQ